VNTGSLTTRGRHRRTTTGSDLHTRACVGTRTRSRGGEEPPRPCLLETRRQKMFWVWADGHAAEQLERERNAECRPRQNYGLVWLAAAVGVTSRRAHRIRRRHQIFAKRTDSCWSSGHEHIRGTLVSMGMWTRVASSSDRFHLAAGVRALRCHDYRIRSSSEGQQRPKFAWRSNWTQHELSRNNGREDARRSIRRCQRGPGAAAMSHSQMDGSSRRRPHVADLRNQEATRSDRAPGARGDSGSGSADGGTSGDRFASEAVDVFRTSRDSGRQPCVPRKFMNFL